jgi:hypothetical protein
MEKDGIARRYKITTVGTTVAVLDIEEVDSWPFATGTAILMSHRVIGRALADLAVDIQQIQTSLLRATLNNAYYANNQRLEVSETHATETTLDDILNNRVGGIVRTKMPGGIKPIETQPIGHWILPVIEHMTSIKENRTGVSRYNQGLDADSLNHTATGVTRIMDAAMMRIKLVARVIAETLIVDTFRGLHGMLQKYDEATHVAKLRGKWTEVNPREWKTRRRMKVDLPLSGASKQEMIGFFSQLLGIQEKILRQQGGPNGPMVSYQNIYATIQRLTKLAGINGIEPYFMYPPPPDPNAPPPPNPEMVKAQGQMQVAQAKLQGDAALNTQKLQSEQAMELIRTQIESERDRNKAQHEQYLNEIKLQHQTMLEGMKAHFNMQVESFRTVQEAKLNEQQAALSAKQGVGDV